MASTGNPFEGGLDAESREQRENEQPNSFFPSLENPTREFLYNSFTVTELRKHCRQLGLTKVWVNKDELVDMILRSTPVDITERTPDSQSQPPMNLLETFRQELDDLKVNMANKDSQIEELNDMLKKAYVTINRLNDRITILEDQIRHQTADTGRPIEDVTLLLGDDNLNEVRVSDLDKHCVVKSIKDVTLDLMKCWVSEKLDIIPTKCIVYCGLNDIGENENINSVLDDLGSLITELKSKNEEIELFASEIAPSLDENIDSKINHFNEKLGQWSIVNGVKLIKTNLSFKLATGEIDEMCYKSEIGKAGNILNRYGTLRLLFVINKQCNCIRAKEIIEASNNNVSPKYSSTGNRNNYNRRNTPNQQLVRQNFERRHSRPNYQMRRSEYPRQHHQAENHQYERAFQYPNTRSDDWRQKGCFNCGEYNHRQTNCRYDHRIRCNYCFKFGHKSRMCTMQSS